MKTRFLYLIYFIMLVTDILIVNLSFLAITNIFGLKQNGSVNLMMVANYIWVLVAMFFRLYTNHSDHKLDNIYRLTIKTFILFVFLFLGYVMLFDSAAHSFGRMLLFFSFLFAGLLISRALGAALEKTLIKNFKIARPVAVIGLNSMGLRLAGFFQDSENHFAFEGFLNREEKSFLDRSGKVLPVIKEQITTAADAGVKDVFITLSPDRIVEYGALQEEAEKHCMRLKLVPDMSNSATDNLKLSYMGDFAVLSNRDEPLEEMENRFKKRVFDIIFSSLVIIFILSWLYPLIAILIKRESPGPVLFKQLRSGKDNQSFLCYKFRSMKVNNDENKQATQNDSRVTKIGAFLRRTSLDELPQFFNVFLGDMSVIGPRPHPLNMTEQYSQIINQYMVRQFLKSGITGWAQVNGFRGETKDPILMQKRVEHDIWYLENWSMWVDLKIILKTINNILVGEENAY